MEKRFWAMIIKRLVLETVVIFLAGVAFDYFAEYHTPITAGLVAIALFWVAWICTSLINLATNLLAMWLVSTKEISNAIVTDLRASRIPAPRDHDPKDHNYLGFLMDDPESDTDARIRAGFLYGGYKPMMGKGIFSAIRMQNSMDAAVLQYYQEAPKRN